METWVELLLAVTQSFLAKLPLAYLGWLLTTAVLSKARSSVSWNLENSFKGFQHRASKRQFKLMLVGEFWHDIQPRNVLSKPHWAFLICMFKCS